MEYAIYDTNTEIGEIIIGYEDNYIILLEKNDGSFNIFHNNKNALTDNVFNQLIEYFDGKRESFDFEYKLIGTEFQRKVWSALCDIPYGETRSYKDIAIAIGNEKASRAVGMANNRNPISIVVPCHRVIGSDGNLVGYGGGLPMKIFLLDLEKKTKMNL